MPEARIISAKPEGHTSIRLDYADGVSGAVDLKRLLEQGGVFASLGDPEEFVRVSVGGDGRYIEWPCGVDLCADALRQHLEGQYQVAS